MARIKKTNSVILEKATLRAAGLQSIASDLNFGQGLSIKAYNQMIQEMRAKLATYNAALSTIDQAKAEIAALERNLGDFSDRMLTGVATQYGKNSPQYSMAGGVPKTARRRRKPPTTM
jgi:Tfp pilus assembly PilM family ATPase